MSADEGECQGGSCQISDGLWRAGVVKARGMVRLGVGRRFATSLLRLSWVTVSRD